MEIKMEEFTDYVAKINELYVLLLGLATKNVKVKHLFLNTNVENVEAVIRTLKKFSFDMLTFHYDICALVIDINARIISGDLKKMQEINGKPTLFTYYIRIDIADENEKDAVETEYHIYIQESCRDCKYHTFKLFGYPDFVKMGDVVGYISPDQDVDGKGGIGFWKLIKERQEVAAYGVFINAMRIQRMYMKVHVDTEELREQLFGCRYALIPNEENHSHIYRQRGRLIRLKIDREIALSPISLKEKDGNGHCKYYQKIEE